MPRAEPNPVRHQPNQGMLSWGPWLLFAVGILVILAAPMYDHQVIQDAVRGGERSPWWLVRSWSRVARCS